MPNITLDQLRDWLNLPDTELRDKLQELLPYRPETLFLTPATHPIYGEVTVISAKGNCDREVIVAFQDEYSPDGTSKPYVPIDSLAFTKPDEPKSRQLVTLEDIQNAPMDTVVRDNKGIVYERSGFDMWFECGEDGERASHSLVKNVPLTILEPAATPAKPAHPEWLETEEDYQNAPWGTICAEANREPLTRAITGIYYLPADQGWCRAADLAGTRRRVLRWGR